MFLDVVKTKRLKFVQGQRIFYMKIYFLQVFFVRTINPKHDKSFSLDQLKLTKIVLKSGVQISAWENWNS